jgi:plastocyanin
MRMKQRGIFVAVVVVALGIAGCKAKPTDNAVSTIETQAIIKPDQPVVPDTATLGSVDGVVKLTGKAPAPVKIDMTMDPACGMSPGGDSNMSEQYAVHNGDLANVFIYVKDGPKGAFAMPPSFGPAVVMDQKGCRYTPHVIALRKGGSVEFRNSDITMHNIHTMPTAPGSASIDISQSPKGESQTKQFNQVETMIPVRCNNHPWMNAFINVSETPFFAVADADGKFSLKGLPAGEYTLAAVHEKLGEQTMKVTVKALGTADAKFTFAAK